METRRALPSLFRRAGSSLSEHMADLQRQVDHLFEEFGGRLALPRFAGMDGRYWPALDMMETADAVDIMAELPGVEPKDVDISVSGDQLTIKGEKKSEKETREKDFYCAERSFGAFARSLTVPFEIDASKVDASFEKGILRIRIGKPAGLKKEIAKIPVKAAA